jgi:hypothetical protein
MRHKWTSMLVMYIQMAIFWEQDSTHSMPEHAQAHRAFSNMNLLRHCHDKSSKWRNAFFFFFFFFLKVIDPSYFCHCPREELLSKGLTLDVPLIKVKRSLQLSSLL